MSLTEYNNICFMCGSLATETHHLVFGYGLRHLADEDGLTAPVCRQCHEAIHKSEKTGTLSKIIGQMLWEKGKNPESAREAFRERYGRSWL